MDSTDNSSYSGDDGSTVSDRNSSSPYHLGLEHRVGFALQRRPRNGRHSDRRLRERLRKEVINELQKSNDAWQNKQRLKMEQQLRVQLEIKQKSFIEECEAKLETRHQDAYDVEFAKLKEDYNWQLTQLKAEWEECRVTNQRHYDSRHAELEGKYFKAVEQKEAEHEQSLEIQNDRFKKSITQMQAKCDETVRQIQADCAAQLQQYKNQNQPYVATHLEHKTFQIFQSQQNAKERAFHQQLNTEWHAMCRRRKQRLIDGKLAVIGSVNCPESQVKQILEVLRRSLPLDEMLSCYVTEQLPGLEYTLYRPDKNIQQKFPSVQRQLDAQLAVPFKLACEAAQTGLMRERDYIVSGIITHPLYRRKEEKKQVALLQACVHFFDVRFTHQVLELARRSTQPASPLRLGGSPWTARFEGLDIGDYDAERLHRINWDIWTKTGV